MSNDNKKPTQARYGFWVLTFASDQNAIPDSSMLAPPVYTVNNDEYLRS